MADEVYICPKCGEPGMFVGWYPLRPGVVRIINKCDKCGHHIRMPYPASEIK